MFSGRMAAVVSREDIFLYVQEQYGTDPDFPFKRFPGHAVLRHKNTGKWYGLVLKVPKNKLGLAGAEEVDVLNIKIDPELVHLFKLKKGFLPAYHMNKEHWISIVLNGSTEAKEVYDLLDDSFFSTK